MYCADCFPAHTAHYVFRLGVFVCDIDCLLEKVIPDKTAVVATKDSVTIFKLEIS